MVQWKVAGVELDELKGPFQSKPLQNSVICCFQGNQNKLERCRGVCTQTDAITIPCNSSRFSVISFNFIYFNSSIFSYEGFKILSNTGFKSWNSIFSKMPNFRLWLKIPIYISGISTLPSTEHFSRQEKGISFAHSTSVKLWQVGH